MSNRDIIHRMRSVLDKFERSEMLASEAKRELEPCMTALEGVGFEHRHQFDDLCYRLTVSSFYDETDEIHLSDESSPEVLKAFRAFLTTIPEV